MGAPAMVGSDVVQFPLFNMYSAPPAPGSENNIHEYQGFHGTDCIGLCGILQQRRVRSLQPPRGWGLLFWRAGLAGRPTAAASLLSQVWRSSFGSEGLAIEGRYHGFPHVTLHQGGHEAEASESRRHRVTRYACSGTARWTLPEAFTTVRALYVHVPMASNQDFEDRLRQCLAFAD